MGLLTTTHEKTVLTIWYLQSIISGSPGGPARNREGTVDISKLLHARPASTTTIRTYVMHAIS